MDGDAPSGTARRHFHLCLAAILLPIVSVPIEWALAVVHLRRSQTTRDDRYWSRWLAGLVLADTLVASLALALILTGVWGWHSLGPSQRQTRSREAVRIGATIVPDPDRPGSVRVGRIDPDSPAARAGLKPGDEIVAIDGEAVREVGHVPERIQAGAAGAPRTLRVLRAGEEKEVVVVPELRRPMQDPPPALSEVTPRPSCIADATAAAKSRLRWTGLWITAASMVVLWGMERRRQVRCRAVWLWVGGALASMAIAGPVVTLGACMGMGGWSAAGGLAAGFVEASAGLVIGFAAMRWAKRARLLDDGHLDPLVSAPRAVGLGFLYVVAVSIRLRVVEEAYAAFVSGASPAVTGDTGYATWFAALNWQGQLFMALFVVLIGPVGEEILFRGVILPRLARWMGATGAIVTSSALFAVLHDPLGMRTVDTFVTGTALGWARLRTGELTAPVAIHVVVNGLATLCWLWWSR